MDFEFWWLIGFPIFFGLGWLAARIDIKHLLTESRNLPRSYFKGLNFLLNEQPDKAIEAFIEVVKVDPETVDLHFALGSLFRRRGETERAICMHRNLLERSDLAADQRVQALFELGHDYLKAGLLDRAEDVFVKLRDSAKRLEALQRLLEIYQQEKDWQKAIETVRPREHPRRRPRGCRRAGTGRDRRVEARRDAEPDLPRARRPPAPEELPDDRRSGDRAHAAARLSRAIPVARSPGRRLPVDARRRGAGGRVPARPGRAAPPSPAARAGQAARGGAPERAGGAAPRHRARAQPRAGADAPARALPLRELRLPRPPVPLAVPGVHELGDLPAAADGGV